MKFNSLSEMSCLRLVVVLWFSSFEIIFCDSLSIDCEWDARSLGNVDLFFPNERNIKETSISYNSTQQSRLLSGTIINWNITNGPAILRINHMSCGDNSGGEGVIVQVHSRDNEGNKTLLRFTCQSKDLQKEEIYLPEISQIKIKVIHKMEKTNKTGLILLATVRIDMSDYDLHDPGDSVHIVPRKGRDSWRTFDSWTITPHDKVGGALGVLQLSIEELDEVPEWCTVQIRVRDFLMDNTYLINLNSSFPLDVQYLTSSNNKMIVLPTFGATQIYYEAVCMEGEPDSPLSMEIINNAVNIHIVYLSAMFSPYSSVSPSLSLSQLSTQLQLWTPGYPYFSGIYRQSKTDDFKLESWHWTFQVEGLTMISFLPSQTTTIERKLLVKYGPHGIDVFPNQSTQVLILTDRQTVSIEYRSTGVEYGRKEDTRLGFQINIEMVDEKCIDAFLNKNSAKVSVLTDERGTNKNTEMDDHQNQFMAVTRHRNSLQIFPPAIIVYISWFVLIGLLIFTKIKLGPHL